MSQASAREAYRGEVGGTADVFRQTRALSEVLVEPLSDADATIQSMEDASPAKWHLAHTTWFWETFLLRDHAEDHTLFDADWPFLFNSYYEAEGARLARCSRGLLTRPTLTQIIDWRRHVTYAMEGLLEREELQSLIALGIAHEQQHQELLLTDIKHAFSLNPLGPTIWDASQVELSSMAASSDWLEHPGGIALMGHGGEGFAFDNEGPRHRVLLEPFALARSLVTNAQWEEFIADGGYRDAGLWLSDGWAWVQENAISAPLYWRETEGEGEEFTHCGWQSRNGDAPVTHISFYEAEAFAAWAGLRLPTEFEWEALVRSGEGEDFSVWEGNQLDTLPDQSGAIMPRGGSHFFGDCWQFTRSAYHPYPGFKPAAGAVGEYNGKFMSGQVVLKGASCATVRGHSRPSYRNFFYPHQRWQFTGLRLAKDL